MVLDSKYILHLVTFYELKILMEFIKRNNFYLNGTIDTLFQFISSSHIVNCHWTNKIASKRVVDSEIVYLRRKTELFVYKSKHWFYLPVRGSVFILRGAFRRDHCRRRRRAVACFERAFRFPRERRKFALLSLSALRCACSGRPPDESDWLWAEWFGAWQLASVTLLIALPHKINTVQP